MGSCYRNPFYGTGINISLSPLPRHYQMEFLKRSNERVLIAMVKPKRESNTPLVDRLCNYMNFNPNKYTTTTAQFVTWTAGFCILCVLLASVYVQLYKKNQNL